MREVRAPLGSWWLPEWIQLNWSHVALSPALTQREQMHRLVSKPWCCLHSSGFSQVSWWLKAKAARSREEGGEEGPLSKCQGALLAWRFFPRGVLWGAQSLC